jgi:glycosyltransferase involved in cell wall biosynthesis
LKILICSSYFWPELTGTAPYVTAMARHLSESGDDVEVIAGHPHYPEWRALRSRRVRRESLDGIDVHRRPHYIPKKQSAARRAGYEATMAVGSLSALPSTGRPDVVVGFIPSLASAITAAAAARLHRAPFGLIVHDVMGRAAAQSGVSGGSVVAGSVGRCESMIARRADRVGIIAESFRGYFRDAGVSDDRIERLRTWTLGAETAAKADRSRFGWTAEDFVCLHAGNMGHKQGLENIVQAAALPRSAVITFILAGEGNDRRRLEDLAAANRAGIRFIGQQPPGAYEAMLASADVLIVNQRGSAGDMSLPSKLTSYFAAGRPVVAAVPTDGETAHEVNAAGAGLVVGPDDPEELADAVLRLQADPELRRTLGSNAREFASENLTAAAALPGYRAFIQQLEG